MLLSSPCFDLLKTTLPISIKLGAKHQLVKDLVSNYDDYYIGNCYIDNLILNVEFA